MRPTVWLASYPKAGNTWFRILLANLHPARTTAVSINAIDSSDAQASTRTRFDDHLLLDSDTLSFDEIDALRPALYRHLARDMLADPFAPDTRLPVRFVKTHDGYTRLPDGSPLMGGQAAAAGAILIVRDPRGVAASFAGHLALGIDAAIGVMADPDYCFCDQRWGQPRQLRQRLLGWSGFAASWLDQRDIPVHLVRYEDLHRAPRATLRAALDFAGWSIDDMAIARAVRFAAIDALQAQERAEPFLERPCADRPFFRSGRVDGWKHELNPDQIARIEDAHGGMMRRLGYRPLPGRTDQARGR